MTGSPAPSDRARQPHGIPTGGQFAASSRGEASTVSLTGESPHDLPRRLPRDLDRAARASLTIGDHVTSPAGTWEVVTRGEADEVVLRLVERADTAPGHVRLGALARTNTHNPTFVPATHTPEEGSRIAAETGRPVVVVTRGSGLRNAIEGHFGAQALVGEHIQRRTWATGNPDGPYVTITLSHAATAALHGADVDDPPLDVEHHDYEVSRDPRGVMYRAERVIEVSYHRRPEESWAVSADLPPSRGRADAVTWLDPTFDVTLADQDVARRAREVDWRDYADEVTR